MLKQMMPYSKAVGGGVGAAISVIVVWALREFAGLEISGEVQASLAVICTALVVYLMPANAPIEPGDPTKPTGTNSLIGMLVLIPLLAACATGGPRNVERDLYVSAMSFSTVVETAIALNEQGVLVDENWRQFRAAAEGFNALLDGAFMAWQLGREADARAQATMIEAALLRLENQILLAARNGSGP